MEEYRIIKNFENYSVSNLGNVRNDKTGRILKLCKNHYGYFHIGLSKNNKEYKFLVHRLVGLTFIPNPSNKPTIDHIDCNPTNNNVNNLRWASRLEQQYNKQISINNTSGFKGVYFDKTKNKWLAQISINGKIKHLGLFENKEDAIICRTKKAIEIQGEFINKCEIIKEKRTELDLELEALELEFLELLK